MKKSNKLISILLVMAMLLSMAPLSLTAFASANDKLFFNGKVIHLKGNAATIEAGSKSGYTKIKVGGEYVDFSQCKYYSGEAMFTIGDSNYEADLSNTKIVGAQSGSMTGNTNITMTGGYVDKLVGSCSSPDNVLTGNVNITMSGGKVGQIWGAEYGVDGSVNITVTGGKVISSIIIMYRDTTITGDGNVIVTGGEPGTIDSLFTYGNIKGSTNLYSTVFPNGNDKDNFTNFIYRDGSNWKFGGNTATALNGNTLTIASGQTATVDSGKTLSGKIENNGTINVKNGGTLSGTITNKGTIWGYGNISGVTNSGSGKAIKKVTASGTNVTFNDSAWQNNATNYDDAYTATLTAASGYALPASVTVNVGGTTLAASNYTYNSSTGALSIPAAKITADTTVSASALINLSDSANSVTLEKTEYTYTGNAITPAVLVNGNKADANDYTAEYSNNTNVGTATVTVIGKNSYTGSKTLTFKIHPANISSATVTLGNSLIYNGTTQTQTVKSVKVNGVTLTEGVDYTVSGNTGINAGTYTLTITGKDNAVGEITKEWKIARLPVTVTAENLSKTYGEADPVLDFTVSREEFKSGLAGELVRTEGENVGVYAITQGTLTNDNNPNFDITFVSGKFTIEPDTTGINTLSVDNVKSSDKAAVEAVKAQIDNAVTDLADDETKAEFQAIADKCVELLAVINNTAEEIKHINDTVAAYDISTVTGNDVPALVQLADAADSLLGTDNLTAEEREVLVQTGKDIQSLISRYDRISAQFADIKERMNGYDEATVKSSDKADIEELVADIKELTDGQNITADEREYLVNADAECDKFLAKIAETTAEYNRVIAAANGYDKATITSADRDALDKLRIDAYRLSDTDNVTPEEKENLQIVFENLTEMVETLINVGNEIERIISAVGGYDEATVKYSDYKDILQLIDDIEALTDGQNITEDERASLEELNTKAKLLAAKIRSTADEIARITRAVNAYNIDTVKSSDKTDIEKLIARIKKLTDGDNITADEREQLVADDATLDALLERINETAEEIARIEDAVNGYDEAAVKSTDKADIEKFIEDIKVLTDATNITEEERTKLGELDATVDSLIKKIDDTAAEIARIDEAVNSYEEESVKSSDEEAIEQLKEDIKALTDGDNITEEERAALEGNKADADALTDKIDETQAEIERINDAVDAFDIDLVKSPDREAIDQLKEAIEALTSTDNVTEEEISALEEKLNKADDLTDRIDEIEAQLEEIADVENSYNPETVTSDDKTAIEEAIAEIEAVNPDNLTDEQREEYDEIKAELEALLEEIAEAEKAVEDIGVELEKFDEKRVTIFREEEIEALKAKIDELLADDNMGTAEKAKLNEYKAQCDKLTEINNDPIEYFSLCFFYFIWDCLTWKYNGILWLFSKIFGFELNTAIA